jgi:prepilin signal peptidase PulO-like enzyme (type II secretory pathway)
MSIIVSVVDLETMYIDLKIWAIGTGVSWILAIVACLMMGFTLNIWYGLAMVVAVAVLFEGTNFVYSVVRGHPGQGFGDTLIIVGTVGVPVAITGALIVGYYSVMGALLAALAGWAVGKVFGKTGKDIPFAFGPWLAAGWVIALIAQAIMAG